MRARLTTCALTDGAFPSLTRIGKRWSSYLGGQDVAGGKLRKSEPFAGQTQCGCNNEYGSSQEGVRGIRSTLGIYFEAGVVEVYWSSTKPGIWTLKNENARLEHQIAFGDNSGYHVRCMKASE